MIQLQNINFTYPDGSKGLDNVNLHIRKGCKLAFLGENGAGKSTLFMLLNGIFKPQSGKYIFEDECLQFQTKDRKKLVSRIGYVFQDPDVQLFAATVFEDIAFGPSNLGLRGSDLEQRVNHYLDVLGISHLSQKAPHQLSYGQKKQVAVAGVLAMEPEIILFDEPFAWLDHRHQKIMSKMIEDLSRQGKSILISTHNPDFAYEWADEVVLMKSGSVLTSGATEGIMKQADFMQQIGMEVPLVVQLSQKLNLPRSPRSVKEFLEEGG